MKLPITYILAAAFLGGVGATLLEGGVKQVEKAASVRTEVLKRAGLQ